MNAPSPTDRSGVMLADRVPWLYKGAKVYVIDTSTDTPMALPLTVKSIDPRTIRTSSDRWPRFLQARQQPVPYRVPAEAEHFGYGHFTELGVYLVGPDNPHVKTIPEFLARAEQWRTIQRAWQGLAAAKRRTPDDMDAAALALRDVLNTYLEGRKTA